MSSENLYSPFIGYFHSSYFNNDIGYKISFNNLLTIYSYFNFIHELYLYKLKFTCQYIFSIQRYKSLSMVYFQNRCFLHTHTYHSFTACARNWIFAEKLKQLKLSSYLTYRLNDCFKAQTFYDKNHFNAMVHHSIILY